MGWIDALALCVVTAVGCGGAQAVPSGPIPASEQASVGGRIYGDRCASCHGSSGEGGDAPPLVGSGALPREPRPDAKARKTRFETAADVLRFFQANMPPGNGGSLSDEEAWAILAFDLRANGVDLGAEKLDATRAATIQLGR